MCVLDIEAAVEFKVRLSPEKCCQTSCNLGVQQRVSASPPEVGMPLLYRSMAPQYQS